MRESVVAIRSRVEPLIGYLPAFELVFPVAKMIEDMNVLREVTLFELIASDELPAPTNDHYPVLPVLARAYAALMVQYELILHVA